MAAKLTLVLGGARSGKSRHAEMLTMSSPSPWTYVATAEIFDEEMRSRIADHRMRRGEGWQTVEAPLDLVGTLEAAKGNAVLVDCLTLWLTNLIFAERDLDEEMTKLESTLEKMQVPVILVSNEVGLGIVPENALARRFRDAAGRLHQRLAARADQVLLVVAGLPLSVKG
jgi:adenosyl cobinamide kinase/adenosyl cobinamide phosphate guanylyltransferase